MTLFNQLMLKPWEETGLTDQSTRYSGNTKEADKKVALKVFLGVIAVVFTLLIVAYAARMGYEDWRPGPEIKLLWINTAALLIASIFFELARYSIRQKKINFARISLLSAGFFTLLFLYGQYQAWLQLDSMTYFKVTNPAIAFFYLITSLHGMHLIGGLVVWARTSMKIMGNFETSKVRQSIDLCALYSHFLFLVWLVLFGLLFTGNNLDYLLIMCGIKS